MQRRMRDGPVLIRREPFFHGRLSSEATVEHRVAPRLVAPVLDPVNRVFISLLGRTKQVVLQDLRPNKEPRFAAEAVNTLVVEDQHPARRSIPSSPVPPVAAV